MLAEAQITALGVNDDLCRFAVRKRWKPAEREVNSWKKALSSLLLFLHVQIQRQREREREKNTRVREGKNAKKGFETFLKNTS